MAVNTPEKSVTEALATWALALDADRVPEAVKTPVRRHLLDGLGCAIAAWRVEAAPYATARLEGEGPATVVGSGRRATVETAAFANGALVHALDFDDTHAGALVHPTAVVLPALLAVGEETGADGSNAMAAAIAGYEAALRIGRAVRHGFHARGFHATSICGVFAACLVTARLRRLDLSTTINALGIAGSFASGSLEFLHTGATTKQLHPGWAAQAGIAAATLATAGATGPRTILEGEYGLFAAYTGQRPEPGAVLSGLGEDWELARITVKPYPLCQLSHASLDALGSLGAEIPDPEAIQAIEVDIPAESVPIIAEPRDTKLKPRTPYEAKFSLPWDLAVLALDGGIGVDSFAPHQLDRPDARRLAQRVTVSGFDSPVPAAAAPGRVAAVLTDGRRLVATVPASKGGPERPLDDSELIAKLAANCGDAVSDPERLAETLLALEDLSSMAVVTAAATSLTTKRSDV